MVVFEDAESYVQWVQTSYQRDVVYSHSVKIIGEFVTLLNNNQDRSKSWFLERGMDKLKLQIVPLKSIGDTFQINIEQKGVIEVDDVSELTFVKLFRYDAELYLLNIAQKQINLCRTTNPLVYLDVPKNATLDDSPSKLNFYTIQHAPINREQWKEQYKSISARNKALFTNRVANESNVGFQSYDNVDRDFSAIDPSSDPFNVLDVTVSSGKIWLIVCIFILFLWLFFMCLVCGRRYKNNVVIVKE